MKRFVLTYLLEHYYAMRKSWSALRGGLEPPTAAERGLERDRGHLTTRPYLQFQSADIISTVKKNFPKFSEKDLKFRNKIHGALKIF